MKQHATPLFLSTSNQKAVQLERIERRGNAESRGYDEVFIKQLVFSHPEILPLSEIDPTCIGPIPICDELPTRAGPVDIFMITPTGMPVLIECKLWVNPAARREVVGQILDYARDIQKWSYEDLQRAAAGRASQKGYSLFQHVSGHQEDLDEQVFIDSVTRNLRDGRCLLLIVGDGIREGVEAISEYLTGSGALQFSFGLVELPVYQTPAGDRVVTPRTIAKTTVIGRYVVGMSDHGNPTIQEDSQRDDPESEADQAAKTAMASANRSFWADVLNGLQLDDSGQELPEPKENNTMYLWIPAPRDGNLVKDNWITVYLARSSNEVGLFFTGTRTGYGGEIARSFIDRIDDILPALGPNVRWREPLPGKINIGESRPLGDIDDPDNRKALIEWFRERINVYVNVFRPEVEAAAELIG